VPRRLSPAQLDYIAMQVFVQDAALEAANALGVPLDPRPFEWDDGSMELLPGPHKVVLDSEGRKLELSIAHGHADDGAWCDQVRRALVSALASLKQQR
jgi:hypothetical protein